MNHVEKFSTRLNAFREETSLLHTSLPRLAELVQFSHPISYSEAWTLQRHLHEERVAERHGDIMLLLEHAPVYTLGRGTHPTHWRCGETVLRQTGASLQFVDRGGSITYHGPGQVVGYPILKLSHYCAGARLYIHKLEEVLIHTLARWDIEGYRREKKPGVWVRRNDTDAKIAAIGVRIDHGITMHGFSLNVDLDLSPFSYIVPCGLPHGDITSMAQIQQSPLSSSIVAQQIAQEFAQAFNLQWVHQPSDALHRQHHAYDLPTTVPLQR